MDEVPSSPPPMAVRAHVSVARVTAAACLLGAALGMIGRWHVVVQGFGCCGAPCHCSHAAALVGCGLYLGGIVATLLLVASVAHRFLLYSLISLVAFVYNVLLPVIQVGRTVDPRSICLAWLFASGVGFLAAGLALGIWDERRAASRSRADER